MCPGAASKSGRGGRGQKGSLSSPLKTKSIMDGKIHLTFDHTQANGVEV